MTFRNSAALSGSFVEAHAPVSSASFGWSAADRLGVAGVRAAARLGAPRLSMESSRLDSPSLQQQ